MKIHRSRRLFLVAAVLAAAAVFALGLFFAALGVRSVVAGPGADPAGSVPNPGHAWSAVEGHGVDSSAVYVNTDGGEALELRVDGARALRLEPVTDPGYGPTVNVIAGYGGNGVGGGVMGATIGGGGKGGNANTVGSSYGTVGGGARNAANGWAATVAGGEIDLASGSYATVAGGYINTAGGGYATVGGGSTNSASNSYATLGGGYSNAASGGYSTVGGGFTNTASGNQATVGGGYDNTASANYATVGGGINNAASGWWATAGGGYDNTASGADATVGGGYTNTASGIYATVPGGGSNTAQGNYSLAAGLRAKANNAGCFVWGDSTNADVACNTNNGFVVRASGNIWFGTTSSPDLATGFINTSTGAYLSTGGTWTNSSDRNLKDNFTPVDGQGVLASLADIPVTTWRYKGEDSSIQHMGPVGQDFYAAFSLGDSDTGISTVDADGVALAAIQGLYQLSQEQAARIQALEEENASLQQRLDALEGRVTALEGGAPVNSGSASLLSSAMPGGWLLLGGLLVLGGLVLAQRRLAGGRR